MTVLVATNDLHSAVASGIDMLEAVSELRDAGSIVVDVGDFFGGTSFFDFSRGNTEQSILARLYDLYTPGNHDLGPLAHLDPNVGMPTVLCANLSPRFDFPFRWAKSLLIPGKPSIGFVGYIGTQAFSAATAEERELYNFCEPSPDLLARECVKLRKMGARYLVGVSHSGFESDASMQKHERLFDIILAGHCHSDRYTWASIEHGVHVVKAPEVGNGLVRVEIETGYGPAVTVRHSPFRSSGQLPRAVYEDIQRYELWATEPLGKLNAPFEDRHSLVCAAGEAIANLFQESMTVLNLGAFRGGLPERVTRGGLYSAIPFQSSLVRCEFMGSYSDLEGLAAEAGEQIVISGQSGFCPENFITTSYLAAAFGLHVEECYPELTLRAIVLELMISGRDAYRD